VQNIGAELSHDQALCSGTGGIAPRLPQGTVILRQSNAPTLGLPSAEAKIVQIFSLWDRITKFRAKSLVCLSIYDSKIIRTNGHQNCLSDRDSYIVKSIESSKRMTNCPVIGKCRFPRGLDGMLHRSV
jgi:hypothetical protein